MHIQVIKHFNFKTIFLLFLIVILCSGCSSELYYKFDDEKIESKIAINYNSDEFKDYIKNSEASLDMNDNMTNSDIKMNSEEIFNAYKIKPKRNKFGGFKFEYNNTTIDLWITKDLFSAIQYNVDGLLYDIQSRRMVSLTYNDFLKNGLREVNSKNNIENGRELKLLKFEKEHRNI